MVLSPECTQILRFRFGVATRYVYLRRKHDSHDFQSDPTILSTHRRIAIPLLLLQFPATVTPRKAFDQRPSDNKETMRPDDDVDEVLEDGELRAYAPPRDEW
jgi:hypothetical protein